MQDLKSFPCVAIFDVFDLVSCEVRRQDSLVLSNRDHEARGSRFEFLQKQIFFIMRMFVQGEWMLNLLKYVYPLPIQDTSNLVA